MGTIRIFTAAACITSCMPKIANYKTLDAYRLAGLEGVHVTALYDVLGSPDVHHMDTVSHKFYNYYNYPGFSSGSWQMQDGVSGYGFGMSYSCEVVIKTTKQNFVKAMFMTGANCPMILERIKAIASAYKTSPEPLDSYREVDNHVG